MPRPIQKRYEYTSRGEFVRTFQKCIDVFDEYYEGKKRPLFERNEFIQELPNGNILTKTRIGRERVKLELRRLNDPYHIVNNGSPVIECYNISDKLIATFANATLASKLTGVASGTISHHCNSAKINRTGDLRFKYKNDNTTSN